MSGLTKNICLDLHQVQVEISLQFYQYNFKMLAKDNECIIFCDNDIGECHIFCVIDIGESLILFIFIVLDIV